MIKKFEEFINEGIMGQLNRHLAGNIERKCLLPEIDGVEIEHSYIDNNKNNHATAYRIESGDPKILKKLILYLIGIRGNEGSFNDIDVSNFKTFSYGDEGRFSEERDYSIFEDLEEFNGDISGWDVSGITDMTRLFRGCKKFNRDISRWDVSNVESMFQMFENCFEFNQNISEWNISNVETMKEIFCCCRKFNQNISSWGSKMKIIDNDFEYMFSGCESFDQDLSSWVIKENIYVIHMFDDCPIKKEHKPTIIVHGKKVDI